MISNDYKLLKSKWSQAKGLMFSTKPSCMLFDFKKEKRISLHMFFVFFPIDVLFIDKNKNIVEIKEDFKPFTTYTSESDRIQYIIELPLDSVANSKTRIYDKLKF
jgi:uncharacterized membrane protein (UPF0127 family)|tara:strand:- start:134 stop:448 length:315 start_codon:yes stop_codon:yes gene_type:complete